MDVNGALQRAPCPAGFQVDDHYVYQFYGLIPIERRSYVIRPAALSRLRAAPDGN